jgi:heptosyltransferase-3
VNEGTEAMLATNQIVKQVFTVPRGTSSFIGQWRALTRLRQKQFDLVLDFTGSDRSAVLAWLSGAPERWGYYRVKGFWGRNRLFTRTGIRQKNVHVVQQQAALLEQFGIASQSPRLSYAVAEKDRGAVSELVPSEKRLVHVHPVSRLMVKAWPPKFMAMLLDHLSGRGLLPVITASQDPAELEYVHELRIHSQRPLLDLAGKLPLPQLAALAERSALFVGVDSAPLHLAAAVRTPVIGIFGPTSEVLWGPWCEKKLVLSREMDCRLPCKMKNTCPHIACLREMTPEMVLPQVEQFLASLKL